MACFLSTIPIRCVPRLTNICCCRFLGCSRFTTTATKCENQRYSAATTTGKKPKSLRVWHAKKQQSLEKNENLLRQLRAQKLAGLNKDDRPPDVRMKERIGKMYSSRKLLTLYNEQREYRERMTFPNKVRILIKTVDVLEKDDGERREHLKNRAIQYVLRDLIKDISKHVMECDCHTIPDLALALARNSVGEIQTVFEDLQKKLALCDLDDMSNEELAKISFAFGKAGATSAKPLFERLWKEVSTRDLAAISTGDLCHYLWGFAEHKLQRDELYKNIGNEILTRDANGFKPWMLASLSWTFSTVEPLSTEIFTMVGNALFAHGELKDFPTKDLVALVVAFARKEKLEKKIFRKLEFVIIRRRDFATCHHSHLQELYQLLQESPFYMSETLKIIEHELFPDMINSVFDVFFRPRIAWKQKLLKQQVFRAY